MTISLYSYYLVQASSPGTQVWDTFAGAFIANATAAFETWLNANDGNAATPPGAGVISTADNGSGLIRVQVNSTGAMTTNEVVNYVGNNSGAVGAKAVTVIDATHFDIQGSTFSIADTAGVVWAASWIDTAANLNATINAYNASQLAGPSLWGTHTDSSGGATITLTNPMVNFQILSGAPGAATDLVLPLANVPGSWPVGFPLYVMNTYSTTAAIRVRAQDGTTLLATVPQNTLGMISLTNNNSQNGTWGARSLGLVFPGAGWGENQGGTGLTGATVIAHSVPIIQAAGFSVNQVTAATAGRLFIDQGAGIDPDFKPPSGDIASISAAGVFTLASTITAGGPTGDATHVPQITYDAKGRLTTVTSVAITGTAPGGAAGGDLSGTFPNPTVAKVDGVSYPASPSTNTVPVVTSSNTVTYETVPVAAGGSGATTLAGIVVGNGTSAFTGITYTAPTSYSPTDQSGASLTFTNVSVQQAQYGNMVYVYGTLTYPATADGNNAKISVPVAVPSQQYANMPAAIANNNSVANLTLVTDQGASTATFRNIMTLGALTNAQMTGARVRFMLIYPAS